jgi:hypothetical protein
MVDLWSSGLAMTTPVAIKFRAAVYRFVATCGPALSGTLTR